MEYQILTVTLCVAGDELTLSETDGLDFTDGDGSADSSMTFSGTAADINAALDGMSLTETSGLLITSILTITADDGALSDCGFVFVDFLPVNDAPSGFNITVNVHEDIPYTLTPIHFGHDDSAIAGARG